MDVSSERESQIAFAIRVVCSTSSDGGELSCWVHLVGC
jgi:hypothetical protein